MPYIKKEDRNVIVDVINTVSMINNNKISSDLFVEKIGRELQNSGELNWLITKICHGYLSKKECYQSYNDIIGALEGAKLELYRRKCAVYENEKIIQNGDV